MKTLYCLEKPKIQLQDIIDKLNRTHKDCHPYDYTECDYLYSIIDDKEAFIDALAKAIECIELANQFKK